MSQQDFIERREYYRICEQIALQINTAQDSFVDDSSLFGLLNELYLLEHDAPPLLRSIGDQQRSLLNYLKVTNKRIDLLAQAVAQNLVKEFGEKQEVSLSESGLSFVASQAYDVDTVLHLKILLLPQAMPLQLTARVVRCKKTEGDAYKIAVTFIELDEQQRKILARHIIQKQALQRRQELLKQEEAEQHEKPL